MRRHLNELVAKRRAKLWKSIRSFPKPIWKFRRHSVGCNVCRCSICKPHKYPKRVPTRQEVESYE
jgi:hypothetical protein